MRNRQGVLYNLSVLAVGQVVAQLANMAALVYLANYLGPSGFGIIQIGVALMSYALIAAEWGLMPLGIREVSRFSETKQVLNYAREQTGLLAIQALLVLTVGLLVLPRLPFYEHAPWVFLLYLATIIPQVYTQIWIAIGLERMTWVGTSRIVRSLTYAGLVVYALQHLDGTFEMSALLWIPILFGISMILSNLVVNIPVARWLGQFVHPRFPSWKEARRRWGETRSLGSNVLVLRVLFNIDIILLGMLAAPQVAGNYAAASRIMFLLVVAVEVLWAALLPRLSRLAKESRELFLCSFNLYFGVVCAVLLPTALGGFLLGPEFVELIYRGKFPDAGPVFQVLALSYSMLALATFLGNTLIAEDRQRRYFLPLIASSLTAIVGVSILVPDHLGLGASWAMAIAHGLLLLVLVILSRKNFARELGIALLGIAPALAALAILTQVLSAQHVLARIAIAGLSYLALAAWPMRQFRSRLRAPGNSV